jgi:hypothetical protein
MVSSESIWAAYQDELKDAHVFFISIFSTRRRSFKSLARIPWAFCANSEILWALRASRLRLFARSVTRG